MSTNNHISFRLDDIEEMSTQTSFERGEGLFNSGAVRQITKKANRYESVVYGSRPYKVNLKDDVDDLHVYCSCPYDHGGICKHLVAFALKILDGEFHETLEYNTPTISEKEFNSLYSKASSEKKLIFLKQLLDRDTDLQQQFITYSSGKAQKLDHTIVEEFERTKKEIHRKLSNLDIENLSYEYNGHYDYDYDDQIYELAIDKINEAFEPFVSSALKQVKKGNLLSATCILLGLYEGAQNLPEVDNEEYIFGGEYNSTVEDIVQNYINDIAQEMSNVVKLDKTVIQLVTLIFERIIFNRDQKTAEGEEIIYAIKHFEKMFLSFITNSKTAEFLGKKLKENKLESQSSAFISLAVAKASNNEKLWIKTAEKYAGSNAEIMKSLLEKYKSKKSVSDFNRVAKIAFKNWPNQFDKYLFEHLDKVKQKTLYVKALKNNVSNNRKISDYRTLKSYLSKAQTIAFVDNFKESYDHIFYVQLLEIENRFEEILSFVKRKKNSYDIEKLIMPILNIYPSECYKIIVSINKKAMSDPKRNRSSYQRMVQLMKLLKQISSKKKETDKYLLKLYNHKPNLPALRDEMRKAGLVGA